MGDTISDISIMKFAQGAGFKDQDLLIATAIALAESRGNVIAHNAVPPDDSYGLWQINMLGKLRNERLNAYGLPAVEALYDPATNARVAFALYRGRGGNFRDWSTFTGGQYKAFMARATAAWGAILAAGTPGNPPAGTANRPAAKSPTMAPAAPPVAAVTDRPPTPSAMPPSSATLPGLSWEARLSLFFSWISSLIRR